MIDIDEFSNDFKFFKVLNKPGYGWIVHSLPGVVVLPIRFNSYYDSKKVSDIDVGLIHIYRDPLEIKSWEIPGGEIENKEDLVQAALRELCEETGYHANKVEKIGLFYETPGRQYHPHHVLIASNLLSSKKHGRLAEEEGIQDFRFFKLTEIDKMILMNKIISSPTITAIKILSLWLNTV